MDPQARRLTLRPLPATIDPQGARIPIFFDEDAPLIFCRIAGRPGVCMVDTGNAAYTIIEARWAKSVGLAPDPRKSVDEGGGWRAARATIAFGPLTLPHEVVEYAPPAPRGSESTTTVAAILSEDVIRHYVMTVDYDQHAVWFEPIPGAKALPYDRCGLEVDKQPDGSFTVQSVVPGSPADAAGLRNGNRIVAIDGQSSAKFSAADFYALNAGRVGDERSFEVATSAGADRTARVRLRDVLP
jgi:membrane-associated protease RseP (regulator of RpoE activity)